MYLLKTLQNQQLLTKIFFYRKNSGVLKSCSISLHKKITTSVPIMREMRPHDNRALLTFFRRSSQICIMQEQMDRERDRRQVNRHLRGAENKSFSLCKRMFSCRTGRCPQNDLCRIMMMTNNMSISRPERDKHRCRLWES